MSWSNNMNSEEFLSHLDNMIDSLLNQYEENNYYGFYTVESQQFDGFDRDDWRYKNAYFSCRR